MLMLFLRTYKNQKAASKLSKKLTVLTQMQILKAALMVLSFINVTKNFLTVEAVGIFILLFYC